MTDRFVTWDGKKFKEAPPFNFVLLEGSDRIYLIDAHDVTFKISPMDSDLASRSEESAMDEELYFRYTACLRVMEAPELHEEISQVTGLEPTHVHKKGESRYGLEQRFWKNDIWYLQSLLPRTKDFTAHLTWLWDQIKPHQDYFRELAAKGTRMDIYCSYRSNSDTAGFEIEPDALEIVCRLKILFGVSVIIV